VVRKNEKKIRKIIGALSIRRQARSAMWKTVFSIEGEGGELYKGSAVARWVLARVLSCFIRQVGKRGI
jgi:hypothetical protein